MALLKFGVIVAEARGQLNGVVFARNQYGPYVRNKVTPINPQSDRQQLVRSYLLAASQRWRDIQQEERTSWECASLQATRRNIFGDNAPLSGYNFFVRLNLNRQMIGEGLLDSPGSAPTIDNIRLNSIFVDRDEEQFTLDATPDGLTSQFKLLLYATPSLSPGRTFAKSQYRWFHTLDPDSSLTDNFYGEYRGTFGDPEVGKRIFCKVKLVHHTTGFDGVYTASNTIVQA